MRSKKVKCRALVKTEGSSGTVIEQSSTHDHAREQVETFLDYICDNYIKEDATYPPFLWAEHNSSIYRTTNACESFLSHFNSSFYSEHPNFLRIFKIDSYIKQKSCKTSTKPTYNKKVLNKINFIDGKIQQLSQSKRSLTEFVKTMAFKI